MSLRFSSLMEDLTFNVDFTEFMPVYRGLVAVWIGDGTTLDTSLNKGGTAGCLYSKYHGGMVQNLGFVSDYEQIKAYFADLGVTFTYDEWIELLAVTPANAQTASTNGLKAEGYAVGTQDGTAVSSGTYYQNNAKYFKEQADSSATSASSSATSSNTNALKSEGYALGEQNGIAVESGSAYYHNNAAYYADNASQSATSANTSQGLASNSASAANTSAANANTNALKSEGYAVGTQDGAAVSSGTYYQNNAKYYSDQAATVTIGKADKTDTVLETTLSRGRKANTTVGTGSFAFGYDVEASGSHSHAEGRLTKAGASYSHAEGNETLAGNNSSHAEGQGSSAMALASHAEGISTFASGYASHVGGRYNILDAHDNWAEWISGTSYAIGDKVKRTVSSADIRGYKCITANSDTVFTEANWERDFYINYAEIIGNGTQNNARSNARTLDWDGNEYLKGTLRINCNTDSTGGTDVGAALTALQNQIVYSSTEPSNPVTGMIWLKPEEV